MEPYGLVSEAEFRGSSSTVRRLPMCQIRADGSAVEVVLRSSYQISIHVSFSYSMCNRR